MFEAQFTALIEGRLGESEAERFLRDSAQNPLTGDMLAFAAGVMRQCMIPVHYPLPLLDTCGTGGDRQATLNISTAAAFVLAGAGIKVAKHGNRSVSSSSGSSEVLTALGINIDLPADSVADCIQQTHLGLCFAPRFHPQLKVLAPLRKKLGIPTIFNYLGPLCNPAGVNWQVLGVGQPSLMQPMADAMIKLNIERAAVVHGSPQLDEASLQGPTEICWIEDGKKRQQSLSPNDWGLPGGKVEMIRCKDAADSARHIIAILNNEDVPGMPWVLANAALGLMVAGHANSPLDGVQQAGEVVRSGQAMTVLNKLQKLTASFCSHDSTS